MSQKYDPEVAEVSGLTEDQLVALVTERLASGDIRDGETGSQAAQRVALAIMVERYELEAKRRQGGQ